MTHPSLLQSPLLIIQSDNCILKRVSLQFNLDPHLHQLHFETHNQISFSLPARYFLYLGQTCSICTALPLIEVSEEGQHVTEWVVSAVFTK